MIEQLPPGLWSVYCYMIELISTQFQACLDGQIEGREGDSAGWVGEGRGMLMNLCDKVNLV